MQNISQTQTPTKSTMTTTQTQQTTYKNLLQDNGLGEYINNFELYGYTNLNWLITLDKKTLQKYLCSSNSINMKIGHFNMFYDLLHKSTDRRRLSRLALCN